MEKNLANVVENLQEETENKMVKILTVIFFHVIVHFLGQCPNNIDQWEKIFVPDRQIIFTKTRFFRGNIFKKP